MALKVDKRKFTTYLSLGSNLGDRNMNLQLAMISIQLQVGKIVSKSSTYRTPGWGKNSLNEYLNNVVKLETNLNPTEVLFKTQEIEKKLGRNKKSVNNQYHNRIIDIDILLYNDEKFNSKNLQIPHIELKNRAFVLIPLNEIASDIFFKSLNNRPLSLLKNCEDENILKIIKI